MERRVLAWLVISFGIVLLYMQLFVEQRPPGEGEAERAAAEDNEVDANGEAGQPLEGAPQDAEDGGPAPPPAPLPQAKEVAAEYVSLGSIDPNGPYRLLLVATNEGAAIRRAESADPHYRDLHDDAGYLGSLEAVDAEGGGAEVRVVGAGTPAADAGLQKGDVIKAVGEQPVEGAADLASALADTEPGETIQLRFARGGQAPTTVEATLIRPPLEVMRPEGENLRSREEMPPEPFDDPPSFLLTMERLGGRTLGPGERELPGLDLLHGNWEIIGEDEEGALFVPQGPDEVVFRKVIPEAFLEVYKRYKLGRLPDEAAETDAPAYQFELEVGLRNLGDQPQRVAYRLDGPTGLPTEGWWYINRIGRGWFESSGLRDVIARFDERPTRQFSAGKIAEGEDDLQGGRPLVYAGVDSLYFASMLIPKKEDLSEQWFADVDAVLLDPKLKASDTQSFSNVTCRLIRQEITLDPRGSHTDAFTVFCGPKQPHLLAQFEPAGDADYALSDLVYYGWFWWVAKPMLAMLEFFYGLVGNYGIAIMMLTILVRACMLPLSLKQAKNMAKMQELQPEMQRLSEKYKGDMEKRARAQQELFRKHNYNPMGGCLMAFVQLPIFIGLYRGLMLDVELRQAPLFSEAIRWCSNLGAPDMFLDWSNWMPSFIQGFLGPYFNVLPIVTIFLFLLQQKLFMPPPTTEQAVMQQKIMKFMMIFIGFLFYKVASALCIYFIASSVWGIVERKMIPRPLPQVAGAAAGGEAASDTKKDRPANRAQTGRNGQPPSKAKAKAKSKRKR